MNLFARIILVSLVFVVNACGTAKFTEKGGTKTNIANPVDDRSIDPIKPEVKPCDAVEEDKDSASQSESESVTITTAEQSTAQNQNPIVTTEIVSTTCLAPAAETPAQN